MTAPPSTCWRPLDTPLGPMILAASDQGLQGVWFVDQKHFPGPQPQWSANPAHPVLCQAVDQLGDWFSGQRTTFELPLAPLGTPFQREVWQAIAAIEFGTTREYGQVAAALARPQASRAVGAATGRNPLSIIVPCHRLVGRQGALTGYAGGLVRKRALLAFEARTTPLPLQNPEKPSTVWG